MGGLDCSALPGIHNHLLLCRITVVLNNQALINCPSGCDFQVHGLKFLPYSNIFLGVGLFERSGIWFWLEPLLVYFCWGGYLSLGTWEIRRLENTWFFCSLVRWSFVLASEDARDGKMNVMNRWLRSKREVMAITIICQFWHHIHNPSLAQIMAAMTWLMAYGSDCWELPSLWRYHPTLLQSHFILEISGVNLVF